jgi:hypothetical protein
MSLFVIVILNFGCSLNPAVIVRFGWIWEWCNSIIAIITFRSRMLFSQVINIGY